MRDIKKALQGRFYLDGGFGSTLVKLGYKTLHAELYNIEKPEVVQSIHEGYFKVGTNAVCTNTFSCNKKKADVSKYTLKEIIHAAIKNARIVADKYSGFVLYDCGPIGELLYPYGRMTFDEAYEIFAEQARIVNGQNVDGVLIETISDLQEMRAAILAFKENTSLPIFSSMTFEKDGRTFAGVAAESFALTVQALGVDALGVNCGVGPSETASIIKKIRDVSSLPVFAKPNASIPKYIDGQTVYEVKPSDFATAMQEIANLGINILGGCCGTDSEYISALVQATKNIPTSTNKNILPDAITSYSTVVRFENCGTLKIGERVNPTNKPLLKQAILDDNYDYILSMCVDQEEKGADLLDINLGMPGINESEKLKNTIAFIQGVVSSPLVIDTSDKEALNNAVRIHNGICVINSVNGEKESMERVFPIAKKYGAYIICLCLDENGIPTEVDARIGIAKKIISEAEKYGISKNRLIFDPLTLAVSVDDSNGIKLLNALDILKNDLQVKTTLGLSNISFGLPNRTKINGTLFKLICDKGVTSAIVNPSILLKSDSLAEKLLLGKDPKCEEYIKANSVKEEVVEKLISKDLIYCIRHGLTNDAVDILKINANENNYTNIIEDEIIVGLNKLGDDYEKGKVFLPQLIAGSETAKAALDYIKANFMGNNISSYKACMLVATVKGDVHDIGKNIVKSVVGNYGYKIIDLGKDTPTSVILEAIDKYKPQVIGLSALMTTTIKSMTESIRAIKEKDKDILIFVGGAVVTQDYADSEGVRYSKDAQNFAKQLEEIFA